MPDFPYRIPGTIVALIHSMETIAITFWDGLVSPLFDAAATVLIVTPGREPEQVSLGNGSIRDKAALLKKNNVTTLICGAISTNALSALHELGIKVFSWISGPVTEVLAAHRNGTLETPRFMMPGCGHRRRCRGKKQADRGMCLRQGNGRGTTSNF